MRKTLTSASMKYASGDEAFDAFYKDVFDSPEYKRHIKETAKILNISEQIVEDVVTHYFSTILIMIASPRTVKILRVLIYGWLTIDVCIDPNVYNINKKKYDTKT